MPWRNLLLLLFLFLFPALLAATPVAVAADEPPDRSAAVRTVWIIRPSEGLDAIAFIGALSGDEMQAWFYAADVERYRQRMTEEEPAVFDRLGAIGREMKVQIAPTFLEIFAAGEAATLADVVRSAEQPEARLRAGLEQKRDWDEETWSVARQIIVDIVAPALRALKRIGFEAEWRTKLKPAIEAHAAGYRETLAGYDVIAENERLLGRPIEPGLELLLLHYNNPYGVSLEGQQFISHHERKARGTAAHRGPRNVPSAVRSQAGIRRESPCAAPHRSMDGLDRRGPRSGVRLHLVSQRVRGGIGPGA